MISPNNVPRASLTEAQLILAQATASSTRTQGRNSGMFHPGGSRTPWGTPPHASTPRLSKARWSLPRRQGEPRMFGADRRQHRYDRPLRLLFCHLVGGAAERPAGTLTPMVVHLSAERGARRNSNLPCVGDGGPFAFCGAVSCPANASATTGFILSTIDVGIRIGWRRRSLVVS